MQAFNYLYLKTFTDGWKFVYIFIDFYLMFFKTGKYNPIKSMRLISFISVWREIIQYYK